MEELIVEKELEIDKMTDDFIFSVVGYRTNEYEIAEHEATLYKASNYTLDPVPMSVLTDAHANNRTPQEAADDIISMANQWRTLQMQLRSYRLEAKSKVRSSFNEESVLNSFNEFQVRISQLKEQLNN